MKSKKVLIVGLALALTVGTVSISAAYGPMGGGHMMGRGMRTEGQHSTGLTADQQKEAQAIESKYQKELIAKENDIRAKGAELDKAFADGSTTIDQTNTLRAELYNLEQDYWQLRAQVNREISENVGTTYYSSGGWGPMNCYWHDNHNDHMVGRGMMGNGYMRGGYCNW